MENKVSNSQRKRTMVYSNVKKKADEISALNRANLIDLDDEVVIGMRDTSSKKKNKRTSKEEERKKVRKK